MTDGAATNKSLSVYVLLLISTLAHLTSGQQNPLLSAGFIAILCGAPFLPRRLCDARGWLLTLNGLTLAYLLFGIGQLIVIGVSPMQLASSFLLVLMTNKLLGPKKTRDRMQLILLSLLQMVIASALSSGLTLGIFLILYTFCLPAALTLLSMERDHELYIAKGMPFKSMTPPASRRLRMMMAATGFAVLFGAVLFFVFIPRLGFGLFAPNHQGQSMTGFSGQVELGDFGRIQTNRKTVMRVRLDDKAYERTQKMYWRGISLDRYEDGRWNKSFDQRKEIQPPREGFLRLERQSGSSTTQEIFLEPLDERVLFGLSKITSISRCPRAKNPRTKVRFFKDIVADLYYETPQRQTLRYCLKSHQPRVSALDRKLTLNQYREHSSKLSDTFRRTYLQVPPTIIPTLNIVLDQVDFKSDLVMENVDALERHLERNYRYTLDRESDTSVKPVTDFLLKQPEGHCEYFATAMVLLLRQKGIAARLVNGFAGGRRNEFGEYIVVHQGNAHSWVEVFVPRKDCREGDECTLVGQWLTIDPTPSQERIPEGKSVLRDMIDALQLRWAEYVVRYDLRTQLTWMTAVFEWVTPSSKGTTNNQSSTTKKRTTRDSDPSDYTWAYWVCAAFTFIFALLLLRRKRTRHSQEVTEYEASRLFEEVVRHYQPFGIQKTADQTAHDWLVDLETKGRLTPEISQFVKIYERCRFRAQASDVSELRVLRTLIIQREQSNQ